MLKKKMKKKKRDLKNPQDKMPSHPTQATKRSLLHADLLPLATIALPTNQHQPTPPSCSLPSVCSVSKYSTHLASHDPPADWTGLGWLVTSLQRTSGQRCMP
ncbi:hypothetical protein, variant 2 [Blastomyces dermatitidis ER-3]|nr:hypothetical protein, variant 1 [Blastomyces dermatitidis ER-3]XP_045281764.1 hypothetical protein, variant 2 [Blastomyces dermatitidis ER-3]OAT02036.1 hypothetical protein, variant 1 [Blastomyces dermatitidis ER-3]OAT02037.1 hypothetical protein, variant 2 [Blastomyces dermatitidis ER-3]